MKNVLVSIFFIFCFNSSFSQTTFTFSGNGNWTDESNWHLNSIPPDTLTAGSKINISPVAGGRCILNIRENIAPGAMLNILPNAVFIINGDLNIHLLLPIVTTNPITNINTNTAIIGGTILAQGESPVSQSGVVWSTSPNPSLISANSSYGASSGSYHITINGLQPGIRYYVRSFATNASGNHFQGVTIGAQVWMNKNLDVATYLNGDSIPQVTDPSQWEGLTTGAWCYYNNSSSYDSIYGKLYNWYAVNDPRGLAPAGTHIPTDGEWTTLTNFLGGEANAGGAMKTITLWNPPNAGATNSSGFDGLPGGYRFNFGVFYTIGYFGYWWSSTPFNEATAWYRNLYYNYTNTARYDAAKTNGFSVRCIRD
jgi:uncharacterized protein (TIGR02145 family)